MRIWPELDAIDPAVMERLEIDAHVERHAVIAGAATNTQPHACKLGVCHVHARCVRLRARVDAVAGGEVDHTLFEGSDEVANAEIQPFQIDQRIHHEHAGAVVGDLPATVDLHDRYVARFEQVLAVCVQAQREHRRVFGEPDLIRGLRRTRVGEALHRPPQGLVVLQPETADPDCRGQLLCRPAHRAIMTSSCAVASR